MILLVLWVLRLCGALQQDFTVVLLLHPCQTQYFQKQAARGKKWVFVAWPLTCSVLYIWCNGYSTYKSSSDSHSPLLWTVDLPSAKLAVISFSNSRSSLSARSYSTSRDHSDLTHQDVAPTAALILHQWLYYCKIIVLLSVAGFHDRINKCKILIFRETTMYMQHNAVTKAQLFPLCIFKYPHLFQFS